MTVTIDRLGRVVVPKKIREHFRLDPGTELVLEVDVTGFHLKPSHAEPTLVRKKGVLVHHGTETVDLDVLSCINADRDGRNGQLVAEDRGE